MYIYGRTESAFDLGGWGMEQCIASRTMKLMEDPPPRMLAQGTMAFLPLSHLEGLDS